MRFLGGSLAPDDGKPEVCRSCGNLLVKKEVKEVGLRTKERE